ncbi:hypothetical protein [Clostridium sp. AN503]|uniref:hypothetical protein n=1 Tax=Clostridium sp. AN503 TaxID=3160598 RepID=UPI00345A9FEF
MPTERFYRLPEAKKQLIREAAIKEFSRVPYERASINQIIHNADISRAAFTHILKISRMWYSFYLRIAVIR